jgi:nitrate reductase gamma subunit
LAQAVTQIRRGLAGGAHDPVLELLVHDFTTYHLAMAGLGAAVTVALLIGAVVLWRRHPRFTSRESAQRSHGGRLLVAMGTAAMVTLALLFAVVTAGNVSTVAQPAPALLGFFEGGG